MKSVMTEWSPMRRFRSRDAMRGGITVLMLLLVCFPGGVKADDQWDEKDARATAVALNYCRASFHRLRTNPSKRVLLEEQTQILNNLNLNRIGDQEVITLYTSVIDEIGRERIAEKERDVIQQGYRRAIRSEAFSKAFVLGTQISTAQYTSAIRTGATSWWDYRAIGLNRDLDLWKVDKTRMTEVVGKSSAFMDTFWKLAQRKKIPDRWLVRNDDLDRLDAALTESDPAVRLRVLQRMDRFMECYPPYLYHVARTQQSLGQLFAAAETYGKLEGLGAGHFRQDDMLATGIANRAAIQAFLKQPSAPETARKALEYSTGAWQANLVCARVLAQAEDYTIAEDAILRNLDVDLETTQSAASLVALYCESANDEKLARRLQDPAIVAVLPTSLLLRSAAHLGTARFPSVAMRQVVSSLYGYEQQHLGKNQMVFVASSNWEMDAADVIMRQDGRNVTEHRFVPGSGMAQLMFTSRTSPRNLFASSSPDSEVVLDVRYPGSPPLRLHLKQQVWSKELLEHAEQQDRHEESNRELLAGLVTRRRVNYLITDVEFGNKHLAMNRPTGDLPTVPARIERRPDLEPVEVPGVTSPSSPTLIPVTQPNTADPIATPAIATPRNPTSPTSAPVEPADSAEDGFERDVEDEPVGATLGSSIETD